MMKFILIMYDWLGCIVSTYLEYAFIETEYTAYGSSIGYPGEAKAFLLSGIGTVGWMGR